MSEVGKGDGGPRGRGRIRIAVVGCGYIAQAEHIPCLLAARGCELAAIVEPRPRTRKALAERLAVPAFATMEELLSDDSGLDAVDICATPGAHAPLVEVAAAAGKRILLEKPICHSPSEARAIVETVARHGVHLMVGYMRRFDDIVLEAKRLLDSGRIGRLRSIATVFKLAFPAAFHRVVDLDPEAPPASGSGSDRPADRRPNDLLPDDAIMEQSVHHLNLVRFLGGEVREVIAAHVEPGNTHVLMSLESGVVVNHSHVGNAGHGEEFRLYGEEGMIHACSGCRTLPTGSRSSPGSPARRGRRSAGSFPSPIPTSRSSKRSPGSSARGHPTRARRRARSATSRSSPAFTRPPPADRRATAAPSISDTALRRRIRPLVPRS